MLRSRFRRIVAVSICLSSGSTGVSSALAGRTPSGDPVRASWIDRLPSGRGIRRTVVSAAFISEPPAKLDHQDADGASGDGGEGVLRVGVVVARVRVDGFLGGADDRGGRGADQRT